ncbi:hypothetical protein L596_004592 [Steinernema carpocapsae]|uniref:Uncharacterized protein n=1 Tax=Steinernema carpocapsae TaxID=34508 RepID=A0A4U8UW99_STECR|nr:hypothetical protein L596_004592 [Steinernema carpocapsae]
MMSLNTCSDKTVCDENLGGLGSLGRSRPVLQKTLVMSRECIRLLLFLSVQSSHLTNELLRSGGSDATAMKIISTSTCATFDSLPLTLTSFRG